MEHFRHPRNAGVFDECALDVGTGFAGSRSAGQLLRLQIRVAADRAIAEACFKAYGCPWTIATGSWLTEWLQGKDLEAAQALTSVEIAALTNLPATRLSCSIVCEDAIQAAIADYAGKRGRKGEDGFATLPS